MSRIVAIALISLAACTTEAPVEPAAEPAAEPEAAVEAAEPAAEVPAGELACQAVDLGEHATGAYTITDGGDDHVRHTFELPEGTTMLKASVALDADWPMKFDVGLGQCPHHGVSMATTHGQSELEISLAASELEGSPEALDTSDRWFVHIGIAGEEAPAVGEVNAYQFSVEACQAPAAS